MAKGWPTISKGVFHAGYNAGKNEGPSAGDRSMQTVSAKSHKQESALGRMLYQAKQKMTAMSMRKPRG